MAQMHLHSTGAPDLRPMASRKNFSLRRIDTTPIWKISGRASARRSKSGVRSPSSYRRRTWVGGMGAQC
jgi:hypothetical protein